MPTYDYRCKACSHELEVVQSFSDDPLTTCDVCGGELRKLFGAPGIAFKGSGFYKNDSRGSSKRSTAASSDTSSSDKASSDTGSSSSDKGGSDKGGSSSSSNGSGSKKEPAPSAASSERTS